MSWDYVSEEMEGGGKRRRLNMASRHLKNYFNKVGNSEYINKIHHIVPKEKQSEYDQESMNRHRLTVMLDTHFGRLSKYIKTRTFLMDEEEAVVLFKQMCLGVKDCHDNGFIFLNMTANSFLFKDPERKILMISGLESAEIFYDDDDSMKERYGIYPYTAPELYDEFCEKFSGRKANVWSLGVILYIMLCGIEPFEYDDAHASRRLKLEKCQYKFPEFISAKAKCLIHGILRCDPKERFTIEQVLQHPWFYHRPAVKKSNCDQIVPKDRKKESEKSTAKKGFFEQVVPILLN